MAGEDDSPIPVNVGKGDKVFEGFRASLDELTSWSPESQSAKGVMPQGRTEYKSQNIPGRR